MAIAVNPPPQAKIPDKFLNDKESRDFFIYLQEVLFKLWLRTGGGEDTLSGIVIDVDGINSRLDAIEERLDLIEPRLDYLEGSTVVTAIDHTTEGNQVVICTAAVTITLALEPLDRDEVSIKAINGDRIIINGNGETIDGEATVTIRANSKNKIKTGLTMRFSSDLSGWVLI